MQVIDLSQTLETGMPVFPGSSQAKLVKEAWLDVEGYNEIRLHISTHTGTHIDCGCHLLKNGLNTITTELTCFYGIGIVIDCRPLKQRGNISKTYLQQYEDKLKYTEFILLYTGWSQFWGLSEYIRGFPVLDKKAADYLVEFNLKGIGTDSISFDPWNSHKLSVHKILLSHGMVLIENLTNLENLPGSTFIFCCFPLKIKNGDGSPVRAVGVVMSNE